MFRIGKAEYCELRSVSEARTRVGLERMLIELKLGSAPLLGT